MVRQPPKPKQNQKKVVRPLAHSPEFEGKPQRFHKRYEPGVLAAGHMQNPKNIVNIESSQEVTTSGISPHIWVEELSITGDA